MEELLTVILYVVLFFIYLLLLPAILIVATPFVLLWPGKKQTDGSRAQEKRDSDTSASSGSGSPSPTTSFPDGWKTLRPRSRMNESKVVV